MQTHVNIGQDATKLEIIEFYLKFNDRSGAMREQSYGINVSKVREIIRMPELTILPNLPNTVKGIFKLRDSIIPALDLREFLYHQQADDTNCKVVIAEFNMLQFGFIVDEVRRIQHFTWDQVEAPSAVHNVESNSASIVGIIKADSTNILMVDVEKIVAEINPQLAIGDDDRGDHKFGEGLNIVIADDSQTIQKMIKDRLELAGFNVTAFKNGVEAWTALQNMRDEAGTSDKLLEDVSLIISDIEMPQMDGYSLTKHIKDDHLLQQVPVVLFSSIINDEIRHKGYSVGADAQLSKPQLSMLLDTVQDLLQKRLENV